MKAVILAAGRGTRLKPITDSIPKVMVPINGKPILQIIIEQLRSVDIKDIVMVTHYLPEKIKDHFGDGSAFGVKIQYVEQQEMRGTAHAVLQARAFVGNDTFLCIAGDSLFPASLLRKLLSHKVDGVITCKEVEDTKPFGILHVEGKKVLRVVEKPENPPSNLANFSVYLFPAAIFEECRKVEPSVRGELEINDAIHALIDQGIVFEYEICNDIIDIGTPTQLDQAHELAKKLGL